MREALTDFVWFYLLVSAGAGCLLVGSFLVWAASNWMWKAIRSVTPWPDLIEAMALLKAKRAEEEKRKAEANT